jgi:hypothetical protein
MRHEWEVVRRERDLMKIRDYLRRQFYVHDTFLVLILNLF